MTRKIILVLLAVALIGAIAYYSNWPRLNVEPHAAQEIEKARKR